MVISGNDMGTIHKIKQKLNSAFEMKDLGFLLYFLRLEAAYSPRGYLLSQLKYASDIVSKAQLQNDTKKVDTPLEVNAKFRATDGEALPDPSFYRKLVGKLIYLTISCPDIAYAVHMVSQFLSAPRSVHLTANLHIIHYVMDTRHYALIFSSSTSLELRAYKESDFIGNLSDRKSTTGFCIFLGDSLISWKSKKHK
ncbi:uncharacterized protein LOC110006505 [Amborella trichopoda]|uniref:uncharacterized protein LOC110006505 n=1 Tax=Amborella trichopoda TaxID=13333 RepID=UPI0009C111E3|nr:uncharacterized protein LOC110006505 [Amborella trichopoda]|eukprot:XP_020517825.1 uncharacterized protein LOC110006505 [Amborella trichopoda]